MWVNKWELRCIVNFFNTYRTDNYYYRRRPLEENIFSVSKHTVIKETWKLPCLQCGCFFSPCHKRHSGEKKPFQTSSFHAAMTPRVWDSRTDCNNNCKQWNFLHVAEKGNKADPVSNSEPSKKNALMLNCYCRWQRPYLCLCLESFFETLVEVTLVKFSLPSLRPFVRVAWPTFFTLLR